MLFILTPLLRPERKELRSRFNFLGSNHVVLTGKNQEIWALGGELPSLPSFIIADRFHSSGLLS